MRNEFLEKLLRRKQGYLLTAFLNQAAHPMKYACLGLFLAGRTRGIKLIVKRNICRSRRYFKTRMGMRWTLKLHVRAWMQSGRAIHRRNRSMHTDDETREHERAE
jgi:hypothetical protein